MMKKTFLLLAVLCATAFVDLSAQIRASHRPGIRYQGDVSVGYGYGTGAISMNQYTVETVHGVRVNPYFFAGAGIGFHCYTTGRSYRSGYNGVRYSEPESYVVPIYANLKGYLPTRGGMVVPFLSLDMGYGLVVGEKLTVSYGSKTWFENMGGFLVSPSIGILIARCVTFSVGYRSQSISAPSTSSVSFDALLLRLGVQF